MQITQEERTWGMFAHLAALAMFTAIPAGNVLGPLIVWLIKKDEMPFVDMQGKEALNFQLSMLIYGAVALLLTLVCIGYFLIVALLCINLVYLILAALEANKGLAFRYPFTIRFLK